ncbi:hypothetical protein [Aquimarina muelleri]|uniref:Uncharacterized protein n=1 Tax=Aquimarina muelleri TaxID=279356 RepID=A0A918JUU3_9FLAO|nr:hypothetical protein [Aquimarina muelleri]MCX2762488.1 hypothetical protein [Aquimarina muelleri]GGX20497.1 hypothetical protein GCM10007384_22290 [Aquimarina muelleri]
MTLTTLPSSELKTILEKRKKDFASYRIANGKISKNTESKEDISEIIDRLTKQEIKSSSKKEETLESVAQITAEDTTKATQTYTEKIKNGYFGKRKTRF